MSTEFTHFIILVYLLRLYKTFFKYPHFIPYHFINIIILAVSGVVFAQRSHQDHGHEAHQEDDHHERVKDGEPVDLKGQMRGKLKSDQKIVHITIFCTNLMQISIKPAYCTFSHLLYIYSIASGMTCSIKIQVHNVIYPVLEEVGVQILVESVIKLHIGLVPLHLKKGTNTF